MPDIFKAEKVTTHQDHHAKQEKPHHKIKPKEGKAVGSFLQHTKSGHALSSFYYFPENVNFETKESEEKIILLLRKHFITNVPWIFVLSLMIVAPLLLTFFPVLSFLPESFEKLAILGWYLITTAYFLESFLTWFFNVNIITDERIVDIDFYNLIYKEVSDTTIERVQDVTYKMGGVIRTVFNYGDVLIQTAAEVPEFEFEAVPKPDRVVSILQQMRIEEEQEKIEGRVR